MIDRELLESFGQIIDLKLTTELGPLKYELKSIKDEVKLIKEEVKAMRADVRAERDEVKTSAEKLDAIDKRSRKLESLQDAINNVAIKQLASQLAETLERLKRLDEINDRAGDIQGAVEVLKVLSAKKS